MNNQEFTFEDAYKIQTEHLTEWSKVLNTTAYMILLEKALEENKKEMGSPYDVFRGTDISSFIQNIMREL